ncbi:anti-sigma regulatory factor [Treponema primitia ZAS-2]|uniref:Anti-sigma regulatory factor n=1 Tax=Treponema primitia (strain ATCC BAA-887 / DSM 12427 / ZAS-2) TaxID=545694 RepID=F5YIH7_TREPZ|nr:ATP-binding protein [Treponema primitia]AEF86215.1 anti-sigma regulatory factor [Treponema primitia ZAS-2]
MAIVYDSELCLPASLESLDTVMDWVTKKMDHEQCPRKIQNHVAVVTEELFVNICHYAYAAGVGQAVIRLAFKDHSIYMQFEDSGIPFNPLEHSAPDIKVGIEDQQIGGLGIHIVRKWMDSVSYERTGEKNILTLRKSTNPAAEQPGLVVL